MQLVKITLVLMHDEHDSVPSHRSLYHPHLHPPQVMMTYIQSAPDEICVGKKSLRSFILRCLTLSSFLLLLVAASADAVMNGSDDQVFRF